MDLISVQELKPGSAAADRPGAPVHRLLLSDRQSGSLTGVREVISFDENQAVLDTEMGLLTVKGKDLHLSRLALDRGEAEMTGTVDSLTYSASTSYRRSGESLFARLFK